MAVSSHTIGLGGLEAGAERDQSFFTGRQVGEAAEHRTLGQNLAGDGEAVQ